MNKRNILLFTQTAFMFLAFLLAALTQLKIVTPWQVMLVAALNGIVMAFDAPSRQSLVVELVGKENLPNAIALNSVAFNSSRIIGPALAGIFVATIGMSACFYVNGISFLAMIFPLFLIRLNQNRKNNKNNTAFRDLKDGLIFMKSNRLILILMTMVGSVSLFGVAYVILMPIFANDILRVGVKGLGFLMSAAGFGALIGALILARLGDFKYKGKFLVLSFLIFSVSLIAFSLSKIYFLSLLSLVFIGGSSVAAVALINTLLQINVPDELRGRVMSVFMLTFAGIMPFGNLIAGILSQALGASLAVMLSGITCLLFFVIINAAYPEIKKI
jgi:MFS family permease